MIELFQTTYASSDLANIAQKVLDQIQLAETKNTVVALSGELGAGKSTLVREILYRLGLNKNIPVLSPTFSYYQIYEINLKKVIHADFYRASKILAAEFTEVIDSADLCFIEWLENGHIELKPDFFLNLSYVDEDFRTLKCLRS